SRRAGAAELLDGALDSLVVDDPEDLEAIRRAVARALGPDGPSLGAAARRLAERLPWAAHIARVDRFLAAVARERLAAARRGAAPLARRRSCPAPARRPARRCRT